MWTLLVLPILALSAAAAGANYAENFNSYILNRIEESSSQRAYNYATIKNGTVKGYTARAANNRTIYTYMRIPFAMPPVGDRRFKAPESQDGWEGVLDGTKLTPACPQLLTGLVAPSEDCLYLNVYTTRSGNETGGKPAPVMVYMYGGAFLLGETSYYTGYRMLANDVVLVVPNYRLSVIGFLSTGDEHSPGNYGLKDQNLALRWVQENIAAFGGDPNQVTIFGESAGAVSVIAHLISPMSHGLFHAIIAQSGTALTPWTIDTNPKRQAERIAAAVGCPTNSSQVIVECLRTMPTLNMTNAYVVNVTSEDLRDGNMGLAGTNLVIEPDLPGAFLTKHPYDLLQEGNYPDVPVMIGAVAEEGALFLGGLHYLSFGREAVENETLKNPVWMREELMKIMVGTFQFPKETGNVAVEEALALTFLPDDSRQDFNQIAEGLLDLTSMFMIKAPVLKTADILSEKLSNVYLYSFEFRPNNPDNSLWYYIFELFVPIMGGQVPPFKHGVNHADDVIYLFNMPFILDDRDKAFSSMVCDLWADFATYGTPTPASSRYPAWPKYNWHEQKYYVLNETPTVATDYAQQWIQ